MDSTHVLGGATRKHSSLNGAGEFQAFETPDGRALAGHSGFLAQVHQSAWACALDELSPEHEPRRYSSDSLMSEP
jgi:hypothetical protein